MKTVPCPSASQIQPALGRHAYLQHVDTLARDVRVQLVLLVKVPPEHLRRLVHRVFDLHRDTTTRLRLLDDL